MLKTNDVANNKWLFIGAMAAVFIWFLAFETARRLPYLYTPFAYQLRAYIVFPLLLGLGIWVMFIAKAPISGTSAYRTMTAGLRNTWERVKQTILVVGGLLGLPAGLAWTFIAFPILAAYVSASRPYAEVYKVDRLEAVSSRYDVWMTNPATGEEVALRQSAEQVSKQRRGWNPGDLVCARGRTSVFGTLIDSLSRDVSNCTASR